MPTVMIALLMLGGGEPRTTQFQWRFKAGDRLTYEFVSNDKQAVTVNKGQTVKQEVKATRVFRFDVRAATAEKTTLDVTIDQVQVQHVAGASSLDNKLFEKMKGAVLSLTLTPAGATLEGYDKLVEQVTEKKELAAAIRSLYPEAAMKQELADLFTMLPKGTIREGAKWKHAGVLPAPPVGKFATELDAVYLEIDRAGNHRFVGRLTGKYEKPEGAVGPLRVTDGILSLERGEWERSFNNSTGRMMSERLAFEVRGTLTVEAQAAPTPMEVELRREVKIKLLPRE